ncbi:MAG: tRNA (N(6)-L-threonylcarbamoyladenosine(37)-C(2))-methylthiotransferase MtaB [Clostridiales bacterium]|nr:tRNA (N(6)-L-threonylcarbamoyladenosine(37)-C(2))-methylthiotransferase MtaB [Clostridiales bacterium]
MRRVAAHTLGCKVNQYDTQAMLELFERAGYQAVPFDSDADVYLVNTCTVTGTGDQKSLKTIRRVARDHPEAAIVAAGCLAQRDAEALMRLPGVRLAIGTRRRAEVVELLERALAENRSLSAVGELEGAAFEPLSIERHEGHTRAVMKIQEGCDHRCAYCIIPSVRGVPRSMALSSVADEAARLADAGYRELVLTGIHLSSYGRGQGATLLDAAAAASAPGGIWRVRLGSLEPTSITREFARQAADNAKLCRHFHLSMQSGSDCVLARMRRGYTSGRYQQAAELLRAAMPDAAITTDVLCGFPGETDAETDETLAFVEKIGFARIHVFPYSRRAGTAAADMPDQVPEAIKKARASQLLSLGNKLEIRFAKGLLGTVQRVLLEEEAGGGAEGYSDQYVRVRADGRPGELAPVRLTGLDGATALGRVEG